MKKRIIYRSLNDVVVLFLVHQNIYDLLMTLDVVTLGERELEKEMSFVKLVYQPHFYRPYTSTSHLIINCLLANTHARAHQINKIKCNVKTYQGWLVASSFMASPLRSFLT